MSKRSHCKDCGKPAINKYVGSLCLSCLSRKAKDYDNEKCDHNFIETAKGIGELVTEKNEAYGDSFAKAGEFMKILYPKGVEPSQYEDVLAIVRVFDKLMRIANRKDAFGESPWEDIAGYSILKTTLDKQRGDENETRSANRDVSLSVKKKEK